MANQINVETRINEKQVYIVQTFNITTKPNSKELVK